KAVGSGKVTSPESYAQILTALCAMGIDPDKDEVFSKGASRQYNDEYSMQAEVSRLACEAMDDALRSAKVNERVWIWKNR
ncbi:MAG: hypothetical protein IIZ87_06520, partial [Selenomonas sp.]|nr:hypothetical protein [Selenomonas sp.]